MRRFIVFILLGMLLSAPILAKPFDAAQAGQATIFIDFDGQSIRGSSWNWEGPFQVSAAGLDQQSMSAIVAQVSEDFRPFKLTVTTDSIVYFQAPRNKRIRVIVTPDFQWYQPSAGAVMKGSFEWGDETPAFVFTSMLSNNPVWIAESISHQVGHAMGLSHHPVSQEQGTILVAQDGGSGKGCTGWAPIMGVSFYKNRTTWHTGWAGPKGELWQDDMARIAAVVGGYTEDEPEGHFEVKSNQPNVFKISGVLHRYDDVDTYTITIPESGRLILQVNPIGIDSNYTKANVHLRLQCISQTGILVQQFYQKDQLDAKGQLILKAGTYTLAIAGETADQIQAPGNIGSYALQARFEAHGGDPLLTTR
jgi:hypothetical protein